MGRPRGEHREPKPVKPPSLFPRGRPHFLNTEEDLVNILVNVYYEKVAENPEIRTDIDASAALVDELDKEYKNQLRRRPEFDYEKCESLFADCMDFLTKVYTKKRKRDEASAEKKAFLQQIKR